MRGFRKTDESTNQFFDGKHKREHWYRDNTIYFITARCRDAFPAFQSHDAKEVFWDRFNHYTREFGVTQLVTTLMNNHYHSVDYVPRGHDLGQMMRRIHGSIAKLVNDILPDRRVPFWRGEHDDDYFDGRLRDERQLRRAYGYTKLQAVRAGIVREYRNYPHTRINVDLERAIKRAHELNVFFPDVSYKRYEA